MYGTKGCEEYTEYLLVSRFGAGIYDLDHQTVLRFLHIIQLESAKAVAEAKFEESKRKNSPRR